MKTEALQYYMHDGPNAFRMELAGNLDRDAALQIDQAWRTASSIIGDRTLIVDMTFVNQADDAGRALLARWYREGARLIAGSKTSRALAESIVGKPLPESQVNPRCTSASQRTWRPFLALTANVLLALGLLVFPASVSGAASLGCKPASGPAFFVAATSEGSRSEAGLQAGLPQ